MYIKSLELYYVGRVIQPLDVERCSTFVSETAMEVGPIILIKENAKYKEVKSGAIFSNKDIIGISRIVNGSLEPLSSYYSCDGKKLKDDSDTANNVYKEVEGLVEQGYIKTLNLPSHRHQFFRFHRKNKSN